MSADFPEVVLIEPYVAQREYASNIVDVVQIDDNVTARSLRVLTQLGANSSFKYWITVMSGDNYTVDWTNDDIVTAIDAFFVNTPE
jgi:hypothetical protein